MHVAAADSAGADSTAKKSKGKKSRSPLLSFSNTDMAFDGDVLAVGSYHGFNLYKLDKDGTPKLISSIVCPGGQGDVSIVGDLLLMSVEQTRGRIDCGLEGVGQDVSQERFRGLRIFDISNLKKPKQVGAVQTCRGSHTHSVVSGPEPDGKLIVYNSGTSSIRDEEELAGCVDGTPGDDRTALFRIDIIEIPVEDPSQARIVASPAVFADPETGTRAGLWRGGDHGDDTQRTRRTDQCHDITVFPERNIAPARVRGTGSSSIFPTRSIRSAWMPRSTPASPTGTRPRSTTTAPRSSSPTNGVAAADRAAALRSARLGRRCHIRYRRRPARVPQLLQDAGPQTEEETAWRTTVRSCRCRGATCLFSRGKVACLW